MLAPEFKVRNDPKTYYYTGGVWFPERIYGSLLEHILINDFEYPGYILKLPNGRIWRPLMREILPGMNLFYKRVSHLDHFPNPP